MTEQAPTPPPPEPASGRPIRNGLLALFLLLLVNLVVFWIIFKQTGLPFSPTPTAQPGIAAAPVSTTAVETGVQAAVSPGLIATFTPLSQLPPTFTPTAGIVFATQPPALTDTPPLTTPPTPTFTKTYGACQYTLKPGKFDFLYSIYRNWLIYKNIPDINVFYARIHCAGLYTNLTCDYRASKPTFTVAGWVLILPGVNRGICLAHGGTPQ